MLAYLIYFASALLAAAFWAWPFIQKWLARKHAIQISFSNPFCIKTFSIEKQIRKINLQGFKAKVEGIYLAHLKGFSFKLVIENAKIALEIPTIELELFDNYEDRNLSFLKTLQNVLKIKGIVKRILQG